MHVWMLVQGAGPDMSQAAAAHEQAVETIGFRDVQADHDPRNVLIDRVGIADLRYPLRVLDRDGGAQDTISTVSMTVELPRQQRGTHMSRFVEVLHDRGRTISAGSLTGFVDEVRSRLQSRCARVRLEFPFFLERRAPVTGMPSLLEYGARLEAEATLEGASLELGVRVPVTSLCPCSKEISEYGAHSQRGYVQIDAAPPWSAGDASGLFLEDLVDVAEAAGSVPVYPLLKRVDERAVTMSAYDNPVFVEDIVRNVAVRLREDRRVARFRVAARNQESIHDHSAIAEIRGDRSDFG